MSFRRTPGLVLGFSMWVVATPCAAQDVPPPIEARPVWFTSVSAGLALTAGNSDTSTINLAFDALRDDRRRFVFSTYGLIIRGEQNDELRVDRRWLDTRVDARITERTFAFVQASYLRDRFKQINYHVTPTLGLALRAARPKEGDRPRQVDLVVDASLGVVLEKSGGREARTSPALAAGERLAIALNQSARITQAFRTVMKLDDLGDVLYTFSGGIAASVTRHSELKAEVIDTFKNERAEASLVRNDVSVLVSIVYKF